MRLIILALLIFILSNNDLVSQSNLYMDGTSFDIEKEADEMQNAGRTSYTIHYLDML